MGRSAAKDLYCLRDRDRFGYNKICFELFSLRVSEALGTLELRLPVWQISNYSGGGTSPKIG